LRPSVTTKCSPSVRTIVPVVFTPRCLPRMVFPFSSVPSSRASVQREEEQPMLAAVGGGRSEQRSAPPRMRDAGSASTLPPPDLGGPAARRTEAPPVSPASSDQGRDGWLSDLLTRADTDTGNRDTPRPGGLSDRLAMLADGRKLPAPTILTELLQQLGPIWPSRLTLGGIALGDCWLHPSLTTADATSGLMPLHKLSQWLAYSLIEPLQRAGIRVTDIDGLTGLAEYRNGGLFVDIGMLALRDAEAARQEHGVASPLVVEWRALTVALLDRVADGLRHRLELDATSLPLAKILQGGTWAAGRLLARERRADSSPPVKIISDGTVF